MENVHSTWQSRRDFIDDIWTWSEIEGVSKQLVDEPPPPTILEYRAQISANNTSSIYDRPDSDEESVTRIISGRGRGGFSTILRPGISQVSDALVVEDVQKKIREVSGLGYSNELIEQGVRAMTMANRENKNSPTTIKQTPVQITSPSKISSKIDSSAEKERSSSSCSTSLLNSASPTREESIGPPPPLSFMRQQAQKERRKNIQKAAENAVVQAIEKTDDAINRKSPASPHNTSNKSRRKWQNTSPSSSSSEELCTWRRRDTDSPNRFFRPKATGFNLNSDDFPALK